MSAPGDVLRGISGPGSPKADLDPAEWMKIGCLRQEGEAAHRELMTWKT